LARIEPLGANLDRQADIRQQQKAGVPVVSLRQPDSIVSTSIRWIDPKRLSHAVAVYSAFTNLAVASDVYFKSLAPTASAGKCIARKKAAGAKGSICDRPRRVLMSANLFALD
jgi:hypothetical protein